MRRTHAFCCLFAACALALPAAAEEPVDLAALERQIAALVPAERRAFLEGLPGSDERLLFSAYAASMPLAAPPLGEEETTAWILPAERDTVASWPPTMRSGLAARRKEQVAADPRLAAARTASAAIDRLRVVMGSARTACATELTTAEPAVGKLALPFEIELSIYSRFKVSELTKEATPAVETPKPASQPDDAEKPSGRLEQPDADRLRTMLALIRRSGERLPEDREHAVAEIEELLGALSPNVEVAVAPAIHFEIGNMYWVGWAPADRKDDRLAADHYRIAAESLKGHVSSEGMAYLATAANTATDDGASFVAYYRVLAAFARRGTVADLWHYHAPDRILSSGRLETDTADAQERLAALKQQVALYLSVMTDEWTLHRFQGCDQALKRIAKELAGEKAGAIAKRLLTKK